MISSDGLVKFLPARYANKRDSVKVAVFIIDKWTCAKFSPTSLKIIIGTLLLRNVSCEFIHGKVVLLKNLNSKIVFLLSPGIQMEKY